MEEEKKEFYIPRNAMKFKVSPMWSVTYSKSIARDYTDEQIGKLLSDPLANYKTLQEVSEYLYNTSKIYQNFLYYLSTIVTFDYILFPSSLADSKSTEEKMWERLYASAEKLYVIQPEYNFPLMLMRALANGETYWYDSSTSNAAIFTEVPSKYCQLAGVDGDGLWRYYVNLNLIDPNLLSQLPAEIQDAYATYFQDKTKSKNPEDGFHLVSQRGFSIFCHMRKEVHDYPYFYSMFIDLNRLESDKDYFNNFIKADNIKLIHSKVPVDPKTGKPSMEKQIVQDYHDSIKEHVPDNVAPITTPFDTEAINLDKAQQSNINIVELSKKNVQDDSGISESMFSTQTTLGLKYSTLADATPMYPLLSFFENLVNFKIQDKKFKCKFLRINHYDKLDWNKEFARALGTAGDIRSKYIATSQSGLYEFLMTAKMEQILNFDSLMPTKESAYNSGSTEEIGRPVEEDPAESTEEVNKRK